MNMRIYLKQIFQVLIKKVADKLKKVQYYKI